MRNGALNSPIRTSAQGPAAASRATPKQLLQGTADVTSDRVQEARARTEKTVRQAFDHLYDRRMQRRVRKARTHTDSYVRDHSWGVIGAVAGIALLVGLLSRRD